MARGVFCHLVFDLALLRQPSRGAVWESCSLLSSPTQIWRWWMGSYQRTPTYITGTCWFTPCSLPHPPKFLFSLEKKTKTAECCLTYALQTHFRRLKFVLSRFLITCRGCIENRAPDHVVARRGMIRGQIWKDILSTRPDRRSARRSNYNGIESIVCCQL